MQSKFCDFWQPPGTLCCSAAVLCGELCFLYTTLMQACRIKLLTALPALLLARAVTGTYESY